MRKLASIFLTGAALLVASCGGGGNPSCSLDGGQPLASSDWPKFRADLRNTGRSAADLSAFPAAGEMQLVWKVQTGGAVTSSPAIGSSDEIYIGSADTRVYRIDTKVVDGVTVAEKTWQALTVSAVTSGPALDTVGNVFATSNDGDLYILSAVNGLTNRSPVAVSGVLASPSLGSSPNQGVVYVGSLATGLFAICPNNVPRWSAQLVPVATTPAIGAEGTVYFTGSNNGRTVGAIDAPTGQLNWLFTTTAGINASPVIGDDGTIYVIDSLGRLFGIDPDSGTAPGVLFDAGTQVFASPALGTDGTLYIADISGTITAFDTTSRTVRWRFTLPSGAAIFSSPAIATADRTLVFGADDGVVYALSDQGDAGVVRWTYATEGGVRSSPAIANDNLGTIYVGSGDRNVYALRPPA